MDSISKFQNHEKIITAVQHQHPLQLVDLQPRYPDYVEFSDDEEEDRVIGWDFNHTCNQCHKEINVYHRYYYKCTDSCDYALHTLCAKLPVALVVKSHHPSHTLTLEKWGNRYPYCHVCLKREPENLCYGCSICTMSKFFDMVHVKCAMIGRENHIIYHPSHPHPLQSGTSEPILCTCDACGKKHEGIFYNCTTCFHHTIHIDCAFLPRNLHNQHTHPLTICYSSQDITYGPKCRICREHFIPNYPWSYKCESCRYYVHPNCATSRTEPFMSIFLPAGTGKTIKNFKDADHPNLVNLPFPDQTYSILQHRFSREMGSTSERNLNYSSHQHQHVLSLVGTQSGDSKGASTSSGVSSLSCHDPMKRIELLCNGCVRPIMDVPFYKCSSEDQSCDFVLHEWCTRLPAELPNHPGHTHTLTFLPKVLKNIFGIFECKICHLDCNGFAYGCTKCDYYIDVNCAFIPDEITHEAHPDHILSWCKGEMKEPCAADSNFYYRSGIYFNCRSCDFYLHSYCALFLPGIIHHKLDKHPMRLTYGPVENHKSQYFCEVCEEELDPNLWFYHCHVCAYSLHARCAPVILNFEAAYNNVRSLYQYLNIKFGGIYNMEGHEHSVSLALGSDKDGNCSKCDRGVKKYLIIKCQSCKLTMHWYCYLEINGLV